MRYKYRTGELIESGDLVLIDYGYEPIVIYSVYFKKNEYKNLGLDAPAVEVGIYSVYLSEINSTAYQICDGIKEYETTLVSKGFHLPTREKNEKMPQYYYTSNEPIKCFDHISILRQDKSRYNAIILFLHDKFKNAPNGKDVLIYNLDQNKIEAISVKELLDRETIPFGPKEFCTENIISKCNTLNIYYRNGTLVEAGDCIQNKLTGEKFIIYMLLPSEVYDTNSDLLLASDAQQRQFVLMNSNYLDSNHITLVLKNISLVLARI